MFIYFLATEDSLLTSHISTSPFFKNNYFFGTGQFVMRSPFNQSWSARMETVAMFVILMIHTDLWERIYCCLQRNKYIFTCLFRASVVCWSLLFMHKYSCRLSLNHVPLCLIVCFINILPKVSTADILNVIILHIIFYLTLGKL